MLDNNSVRTPIELGLKITMDFEGKEINSTLYKQIVRSLMHLTRRLDIMFSISLVSRFMECPIDLHLLAAKRILHYIKRTFDFGILY